MPYGFQILTQSGMADIFEVPAFQLLHRSVHNLTLLDQRTVTLTLDWKSLVAPCTFIMTCSCTRLDLFIPMASTNTSPNTRPTSISCLLGLFKLDAGSPAPPVNNSDITVEVWGIKI